MLDSVLISLFTSFFPDKTGRLQAKKIFDRKLKKRYDDETYVLFFRHDLTVSVGYHTFKKGIIFSNNCGKHFIFNLIYYI